MTEKKRFECEESGTVQSHSVMFDNNIHDWLSIFDVEKIMNEMDLRIKELELYVEMLKQVKPLRKLPKSIDLKVYCEKVNDE